MPARFFLPAEEWPAGQAGSGLPAPAIELGGEEFHHLTRVVRAKSGDSVEGLDGRGRIGEFLLESATRNRATLRLKSVALAPRPSGPILAVAWSKSGRRDFLFEKAVELKAARIIFWRADRSQGEMPDAPKPAWTAKLAAAAKQCGNPWLPEILLVPDAAALAGQSAASRLLLWEDATRTVPVPAQALRGGCLAVVGPEGGLSEGEAALFLDAGFAPVSLGPSVLRWETAALAFLALSLWASVLPNIEETGITTR